MPCSAGHILKCSDVCHRGHGGTSICVSSIKVHIRIHWTSNQVYVSNPNQIMVAYWSGDGDFSATLYMCCCVTRCSTVNLLVAVYHIGKLGSRNGHPLNASPCSPASCSRLEGHFSQPSRYLLIPEFALLLQPSLHTVTQQKQQHTLRFFLKKKKM